MSSFVIKGYAGHDLQSYTCMDFSGGIDARTSKLKLARRKDNKFLTRGTNIVLDNDGSVRLRPPFVVVNEHATFTTGGSTIKGGYHYRKSDGTSQVLIAYGTALYNCGTAGTSAPSSIKSGLSASATIFSFATYSDLCIIANGVDAPMQYDGAAVLALAGSSPATLRWVVSHGNRLFGLATATPSRLYWSKLNNPTDWSGTDDAGFMDINPNDGATISTLVSSNQELVILKGNRPYRLQGIGPTTGYTVADHLLPTTGSVGTPFTRGAVFTQNDVWYVSPLGLHRLSATANFGDLKEAFPSDPIEPVFTAKEFATGISTAIDWTTVTTQVIADLSTQALYMGVREVAATALSKLLVYDQFTKGWAAWNPPAEITAMWSVTGDDGVSRVMVGALASAGAVVLKIDASDNQDHDETDAGDVDIVVEVGHISDLGAPNVIKSPRYLVMHLAEPTTTVLPIQIYFDFAELAAIDTTLTLANAT